MPAGRPFIFPGHYPICPLPLDWKISQYNCSANVFNEVSVNSSINSLEDSMQLWWLLDSGSLQATVRLTSTDCDNAPIDELLTFSGSISWPLAPVDRICAVDFNQDYGKNFTMYPYARNSLAFDVTNITASTPSREPCYTWSAGGIFTTHMTQYYVSCDYSYTIHPVTVTVNGDTPPWPMYFHLIWSDSVTPVSLTFVSATANLSLWNL